MPKEKNKTILLIAVTLITLLIGTIVFIIINPTDDPTITETKKRFLPFGEPTPIDNTSFTKPTNNDVSNTGSQTAQKLFKVTSSPVAGAKFTTNEEDGSVIKYVEQKTGDIYEYSISAKTSQRILQQTLLGIHSALWTKDGKNILLRFLKDENNNTIIKTYAISLKNLIENNETASGTISSVGKFLPDGLQEVVVSPTNTEQIIYLQKAKGSGFIITEDLSTNGERKQLFASPLSEWLIEWPKEGLITLTTKPSYDIEGYLYFLNNKTGKIEKILGKIKGLTTLVSPDATKILYAESAKNIFKLAVYNVETKTETLLELKTFPEKCVWDPLNTNLLYCAVSDLSNNTNLPDDWYKGKVSFSDELWVINTETWKTGVLTKMKEFTESGIDVIKMSLSPKSDSLLFTNKKDNSLWMLKLESLGVEGDNTLPNSEKTETYE